MATYDLEPSLLAYFKGLWDEESKSYKTDDSLGIVHACLKSSVPMTEVCYKACANAGIDEKKCQSRCREIVEANRVTCLEYPVEIDSNISSCAEKLDCGRSPLFDNNCLQKNKDAIIDCCKESCDIHDCERQCEQKFNYASRYNNPLEITANKYKILVKKLAEDKHDRAIYVFVGIFVLLAFLAVVIFRIN